MKSATLFSVILSLFFNFLNAQIEYPLTPKKPVINLYHGQEITDDYQWLESYTQEEVKDWINEENKISVKYLKKLERKDHIEDKIGQYLNINTGRYEGEIKNDLEEHESLFSIKYPDYNSPPNIYYKKNLNDNYELLVSSTSISRKDKIYIDYYKSSRNDQFLAYQYTRNGSDWKEIRVVQPVNKYQLPDVVTHTKFSGIHWLDQGFFYKEYPFDSISGKTVLPKIRYHKLGFDQAVDKVVAEAQKEDIFLSMFGAIDEDIFVITEENLENRTYTYKYLIPNGENMEFQTLLKDIPYQLNILNFKDGNLIVQTILNYSRSLVSIPIDKPKNWMILTPTYEDYSLTDYEFLEDKLFLSYQGKENSILTAVDYNGKVLKEIPMLKGLAVSGLIYSKKFEEFFFYMESYTIPPVLYKLNQEDYSYERVEKTRVSFNYKGIKFKQTTFKSHDGVEVPIFIVYKDSLKANSNTPFLIKTYGGYGNIGTPSFDPGIVYFLEHGGAFAYVNVRGGGLLGEKWHLGGQGLRKRNGIYDLTSAAEYLIEQKYTRPDRIGVTGSSHGGLLTAAAITTRPDLFGAAVINVGVMDMLRYENFTTGAASTNLKEYGSTKDLAGFRNLYSYSPYHNIDNSINYPSTLIVTGENDDRVPPLHSFKFAARMQANPSQKNPVLLWTQKNAGHEGAIGYNGVLEEKSFIYGFLFSELTKSDD